VLDATLAMQRCRKLVPMLEPTGQSCLCGPSAQDLASVPVQCDAMMTAPDLSEP
jgi:hypothetical protein